MLQKNVANAARIQAWGPRKDVILVKRIRPLCHGIHVVGKSLMTNLYSQLFSQYCFMSVYLYCSLSRRRMVRYEYCLGLNFFRE